MPDKWEYPWYAAWDLAFHCLPVALIDAEFAKDQLVLLTANGTCTPTDSSRRTSGRSRRQPAGSRLGYLARFEIDRRRRGDAGDFVFLKRVFHKLLLNYTWWVNRKDSRQRNLFQRGFLGLDNISVFDRNMPLCPMVCTSNKRTEPVWLKNSADSTPLNFLRLNVY